jgi:restriction system protein
MWEVRIQHEGLRAFRVLHGATQADAQGKATAQLLRWESRWSAQQRAEAARTELLTRQRLALHGRSIAASLTAEAAAHRLALDTLLPASLHRGRFLHWDALKDTTPFADPPILPETPRTPPPQLLPEIYAPDLTLVDKLIQSRREKKELAASEHFARDLIAWQVACRQRNRLAAEAYLRRKQQREHKAAHHHAAQLAQHTRVEQARTAFGLHEKQAVEYFFSEVLSRSDYPSGFPEDATLQYTRATRTLIVDYALPSIAAWPTHQQVLYNPARNSLHEVLVPEDNRKTSYESALFQIALRILNELFLHDDAHALDRVALNGHVHSVDKATGNLVHACILSILVSRPAFAAINLAQVDPRSCFLKLKGLMSTSPLDLAPVKPILTLTHDNDRNLKPLNEPADAPFDLTSMSRSDFETLIREAFERELRRNRTQVTLAASPHEHGHDAIV